MRHDKAARIVATFAVAFAGMIGTGSQGRAGAVGIVFESGPSYGPVTSPPFFLHPPPFSQVNFGSGEGLIDVHPDAPGLMKGVIHVDPNDRVGQFGIIETVRGSFFFDAPAGPARTAVLTIAGTGKGLLNFPDPPATNSAGAVTLISNNNVDPHIYSLLGSGAQLPGVPFDIPLFLPVPFQIPASTVPITVSRPVTIQLRMEGSGDVMFDTLDGVQFSFPMLPPGVSVTSDFGFSQSTSAVPEPGSFVLVAVGLTGVLVFRRRGWC
jgi:hypothetical protein